MRASNRAGQGLWSAPLDVISGAGAPDKPKEPRAQARPGGTSALVTWEQPINNGAIITGYRSVGSISNHYPTLIKFFKFSKSFV